MPISSETIETRNDLSELLKNNKNVVVLKLGAEWCGPCKKIEKEVNAHMEKMPHDMTCMILDVDECFDLYAFLKSKKIVVGIPSLLAYFKGNTHYAPDEVVIGTDLNELNQFFAKCIAAYNDMK